MDKVTSGIPGLDELLKGGFVKNSVNVIAGTPGTGKSTFGLHFLVEGAAKNEKGIYVTLEESIEDVIKFTEGFGWDLVGLANNNLITLHQYKISGLETNMSLDQMKKAQPPTIMDVFFAIKDELEKGNYKRMVIDSISLLKFAGANEKDTRVELATLLRFLKEKELTVVLIGEKEEADDGFDFEEFLADGVVFLKDYPGTEERKRGVTVLKMRGSDIDRTTRPYFITDKGIVVYPNEHLL